MAVATTAARKSDVKEHTFLWEGVDRNNRQVRGETKAASETVVTTQPAPAGHPHHQDQEADLPRRRSASARRDVTFFTRQLATMLKAGVPLLQASRSSRAATRNARFSRLMMEVKSRIESGSSLADAFRQHPAQFDQLYCNLVAAGESSGMIDGILDRLATYKEKILALKSKIKSALFYPAAVVDRRDHRRLGDHDLRHPGVQGRVLELRRRRCRRRRSS